MPETITETVRRQYEQYPYPPRDPEDERRRLLEVQIDRLAVINFYCFRGRHDFRGSRVLVAGGGTGDSAIYLAEQLRGMQGEVLYVDVSESSMQIARQRAAIRKLDNIRWLRQSILALAVDEIGRFDYISCTGVLHHLEDPQQGLKRLAALLKPAGALGILLYARYGRTGVYQMQKLMRLVNHDEPEIDGRIANTRRVLKALPESNWFRHNEKFLSDHRQLGDAGLVDLLLHAQDVAYGIDEIHAMLAEAGLHLAEFSDIRLRMSYRPEHFIKDPILLRTIAGLDTVTQQAIAELLVGLFTKHIFYASSDPDPRARPGDLTDVPFFFPEREYRTMGRQISEAMLKQPAKPVSLRHSSGFEFDLAPNAVHAAIFRHLDGATDWSGIFSRVRSELADLRSTDQELLGSFCPVFEQFRQFDWLLLRAGAVGPFPDTLELQADSERRQQA